MVKKLCPDGYKEHLNVCYTFGGYTNYEAALSNCKSAGGRLVDVLPENIEYITEGIKNRGGNDHWIGSYVVQRQLLGRKERDCPVIKKQGLGSEVFDEVPCNSAYPYVCQKYGNAYYLNKHLADINSFYSKDQEQLESGGELELPVTEKTVEEKTTIGVKGPLTDFAMIASIAGVITLVVLVIILKIICNRKQHKATKEKIMELKEKREVFTLTNNELPNSFSSLSSQQRKNLHKSEALPRHKRNWPIKKSDSTKTPVAEESFSNSTASPEYENYHAQCSISEREKGFQNSRRPFYNQNLLQNRRESQESHCDDDTKGVLQWKKQHTSRGHTMQKNCIQLRKFSYGGKICLETRPSLYALNNCASCYRTKDGPLTPKRDHQWRYLSTTTSFQPSSVNLPPIVRNWSSENGQNLNPNNTFAVQQKATVLHNQQRQLRRGPIRVHRYIHRT